MNIVIKETSREDLANVMDLWNNGQVMFFVGFPNGLGVTLDIKLLPKHKEKALRRML